MPGEHLPPAIRQRADDLSTALNCPAHTAPVYAGRWRITLANDRVRVTVDYRVRQRGRINMTGSTLAVDGQPRQLARDLDHLVAIFADPDSASDDGDSAPAPMPTCQADEAPPMVRRIHQMLTREAGEAATVSAAKVDGVWTVGLDTDRVSFRMMFRAHLPRRGPMTHVPGQICLWIDGEDRSAEIRGNFDRAVELMSPTFPSAGKLPPARPVRPGPPPAPNQALEVRRHTIIRT